MRVVGRRRLSYFGVVSEISTRLGLAGSGRKRLLVFCTAATFLESASYSILTPLLPHLARQDHATGGSLGVLVAAYPVGMLATTLPASRAVRRIGCRRTAILGLVLLATACTTFAFAKSIALLDLARLIQGIGAATAWMGALAWVAEATDVSHRGEAMGVVFGAAFSGCVMGPLLGGVAGRSEGPLFLGLAAVTALAVALAPGERGMVSGPRKVSIRALGDRRVLRGSALLMGMGLMVGTLGLFGPLLLTRHGVDSLGIGAMYGLAYALQILMSPRIGRLSDSHGSRLPALVGTAVGTLALCTIPFLDSGLALTAVLGVAVCSSFSLWTPGALMVGAGLGPHGSQRVAVAVMNSAWAFGAALSAIVIPRLGFQAAGRTVYLLGAAVLLVLFFFVWRLTLPAAASITDSASAPRPPEATR
jgi:MFS family permease